MPGKADCVKLLSGDLMPRLGLGTWAQTNMANTDQHDPEALAQAVKTAVENGYRHVDTAWAYFNEKEIGRILKGLFDSGAVKREELFITTKLYAFFHEEAAVEKVLREQLADLGLDYVDMYLVHTPFHLVQDPAQPKNIFPVKDGALPFGKATQLETWKGMEACVKKGLARNIGVSNWNSKQIQRIWDNSEVKPSNLQVECHAYFPQEELKAFCDEKGIAFTAYSPIGSPGAMAMQEAMQGEKKPRLMDDPVVHKIAKAHGKTPAQTLIRYLYDRGMVVIPKSTNPDRIKQNFDIFDFKISDAEIKELNALKKGRMMGAMAAFASKHPDFPWHEPF